MKLIRTSFYSAVITFIRIGSGFVASKIVAVFTGPAGVALIGALSNFITIILAFANGAINTGIVKYTAEYKDDDSKSSILFSAATRISIICSIITGAILVVFASYISYFTFSNYEYTSPVRVLGLTAFMYSLNSVFISILNGKGEIKTFTIVNTVGSLIGLLFTICLVYYFKFLGAVYALVLSQSIVLFVTAAMIARSSWFKWDYFMRPFDRGLARKLMAYSLMAIVTSMTGPITQILLRKLLIIRFGVDNAGYWQGMMRVSDGYLMIITTSLSTYYLPKLAGIKEDNEMRKEIFQGLKLILPVLLLGCISIYVLRFFIIKVLYTSEFVSMESLFFWQLVGDFLKMAAWIIGYLMIAKAMTKLYIVTDILFNLGYLVLGYLFVTYMGLKGITVAFALNYFFYLILMIFLFRKLLFVKNFVK